MNKRIKSFLEDFGSLYEPKDGILSHKEIFRATLQCTILLSATLGCVGFILYSMFAIPFILISDTYFGTHLFNQDNPIHGMGIGIWFLLLMALACYVWFWIFTPIGKPKESDSWR